MMIHRKINFIHRNWLDDAYTVRVCYFTFYLFSSSGMSVEYRSSYLLIKFVFSICNDEYHDDASYFMHGRGNQACIAVKRPNNSAEERLGCADRRLVRPVGSWIFYCAHPSSHCDTCNISIPCARDFCGHEARKHKSNFPLQKSKLNIQ